MNNETKIVELKIDRLATDARGVARHADGRIVFVEGALPGETVESEILYEKKNYLDAKMTSLLSEPSNLRAVPPCPYYKVCGGCQIQHLDANQHVATKVEWFFETLRRIGRFSDSDISMARSLLQVKAPAASHYRRRVRLHFDGERLGYHGRRSNIIINVDACYVADLNISEKLPAIKKSLLKFAEKRPRRDEQIEIEITSAGGKLFFETIIPKTTKVDRKWEASVQKALAALPFASSDESFQIEADGHSSKVHRRSFVQPHLEAPQLYVDEVNHVLEGFFANFSAPQNFDAWDLYAGSGLFTLLPYRAAQKLGNKCETTAVEGIGSATQALKDNTCGYGVKCLAEDVNRFVRDFRGNFPAVVIADPPRAGMGLECAQQLCELAKSTKTPLLFVLVSCDCSAFGRDAQILLSSGWALSSVALFDTFAQTTHYECIASFTLNVK